MLHHAGTRDIRLERKCEGRFLANFQKIAEIAVWT
jgi:hypothetical protein